jgi:hypothetical protein
MRAGNPDQSPTHPGLRAHTKPSITVITIIYSQVTRRGDVRNGIDFIGSYLCDTFYLRRDTQKLVVVNNICTGPFENIAHSGSPLPPSDVLFDERPQLWIRNASERFSIPCRFLRSNSQMMAAAHGMDCRYWAGRDDRTPSICRIRSRRGHALSSAASAATP